ncbi:MAG: polysaccharide deacetylase family protein [Alicyclobacillus sp.]|nr:polysaccharide deacetylase family protein [Alicyclobacillus sp.]
MGDRRWFTEALGIRWRRKPAVTLAVTLAACTLAAVAVTGWFLAHPRDAEPRSSLLRQVHVLRRVPQHVGERRVWLSDPHAYERTAVVLPNLEIRVPILMYHDMNDLPGNNLGMAPDQFQQEIRFLYDHGFHTINFGQLYAALYYGYQLPNRPILLTFDDGYQSVYTVAYPTLRHYHFQGTVFMISGWVGLHGKYPMLTWAELRMMEQSGVMDVESHTVHHLDLSRLSNAEVQAELIDSAVTLSAHLRHPVRYFCFPSGRYTAQTLMDLRKDGYWLAVTERPGYASLADGPYTLRRIRIWEGMPMSDFESALAPSLSTPETDLSFAHPHGPGA